MSASLQTAMAFLRRHPLLAPLPAICALLACTWVLFYGYGLATVFFPAYVGGNRAFFRACLAIRTGTTTEEARSSMSRYLEVGRTWSPPSAFPPGLFQATVAGISESRHEHGSRLLFIPNASDSADWCLVYPNASGQVLRVEVSPD